MLPLRLAAALFAVSTLAFPADFWKEKKSADWSEKDARRLITRSPWSHEVSLSMTGGGMQGGGMRGAMDASTSSAGSGGGMGGGGMGGGGGRGGRGGGGGMGAGAGTPPAPTLTVTWESALPVQEARARLESPSPVKDLAAQYYIVSVAGLRLPIRPGQDQAQLKQRLLTGTSLVRKGKDPIAPADVRGVPGEKSMTLYYFFKRDAALDATDKEVEFVQKMGRMEGKTKFKFKDMVFDGTLAL